MNKKSKLQNKINSSILIFFIFIIAFYSIMQLSQNKKSLNNSISRINTLLDTLCSNEKSRLANEIFEKRKIASKIRVKNMAKINGITNISLFDNNYNLIVAVGDNELIYLNNNLNRKDILNNSQIKKIGKESFIVYTYPIIIIGETIGVLKIHYSLEEIIKEHKSNFIFFISFLLITLIFMLLFFNFLLCKMVVHPINFLKSAINEMKNANFGKQLKIGNQDEIGDLANSFNEMSFTLGNLYSQIESQNKNLLEINSQLSSEIKNRKKSELNLIKSKEKAEKASKIKSDFLANMSHEIRTPINGIMTMTELLYLTNPNEEQQKFLTDLSLSTNKLMSLVDSILNISKLEKKEIKVEKQNFELQSFIKKLLTPFDNILKNKNIIFSLNNSNDIYNSLIGDYPKIELILKNLLDNAIKFTSRGEISLSINKLSENNKEISLEFLIKDNGIGIKKENLENIFDYFIQGDLSYSKNYQGIGLGLSLAKKMSDLLKGDLKCYSEFGKGSQFIFTINIEKNLNSKNNSFILETPFSNITLVDNKIKKEKYKILLVEDNEINSFALSTLLKTSNYTVYTAFNGKEAIDFLKHNSVDLILMDIQMPIMNGYEATKIIKSDDQLKNIPIVALTAYAMEKDRVNFLELGMNDYMAKPVNLETLKLVVNKNINRSRY